MRKSIEVVVVDDHRIMREGLRSIFKHYPQIKCMGDASNILELLELPLKSKPDVILVDLSMPGPNVIESLPMLKGKFPTTKFVALTMHDTRDYVLRFIRAGGHGYVLKDTSPDDLVRAIESVNDGNAFFSPSVALFLAQKVSEHQETSGSIGNLTRREMEVLQNIAHGMSNKEIARKLKLGVRTVESHRERIIQKLGIRSVAGLTRFALANGLLK